MKRPFLFIVLVCMLASTQAADTTYIRHITDTLSSGAFLGRGYVGNGMQKAGDFIAAEMDRLGMSVARQTFRYPVNSFPGKMELTVNGKKLKPGEDYLVAAESKAASGSGKLMQLDSVSFVNAKQQVVIVLVDALTWTVSGEQSPYTRFYVLKTATDEPKNFSCSVDASFINGFQATNIIGVKQGYRKADSLIVITAHYDHLGMMGYGTMFAGANDNAGGVALMLSLGKEYAKTASPYTIVFVAFAGEEAGLIGSEYMVQHPVFALSSIRFLLNLDLVGNGDEGITVVNATEFPKEFALLQKINTEKPLLATVQSRGKAKNSDHYWFTEKGVPSFFIYTLGKRKAYHDVYDIAATVPWYEANDLQTLLTDFIGILARQ